MTSQWPPYSPDYQQAPPSLPWDPPVATAPAVRPDYGVRRDLPFAALVVAALVVAGVLCGFAWHAISPRPQVIEGAGGLFQLPADTDKNYFGGEAAFLAVSTVAGLFAGVTVWRLCRRRGPAIPVALGLGAVCAGLACRLVGEAQSTNATLARACGRDSSYDAICQVYDGHLHLRIASLVLTWAIVALTSFLALSLAFDRPPPPQPVSWAPPDPLTQWQAPPPEPQGMQSGPKPGYPPPL